MDLTFNGCPSYIENENLKQYFKRKLELHVENGLLVGNKLVNSEQLNLTKRCFKNLLQSFLKMSF